MSGNYAKTMYSNTLPIPSLEAGIESLGQITDEEKIKTWHDYDAQILGCKHYQRGARVQARCCGKWFTCRFCHDEVSDHNMNRHQTTTMLCMHCLHPQPASSTCLHCSTPLACYYCPTCKLWDDDATKHIYHCDACGICRIGRGLGLDYFHCEKCNACMAIALQGRHRCIERNLECDCPICGEFMFTSTSTVIFMPCGHCIHQTCHSTHIQTSYQCPTCLKSLADMTRYFSRIDAMLASHTMPAEYADLVSNVYCNDCERRTRARYHFVYHKCGGCGGYNTKVVGVERGGEGEEAGV
ncbi:zinc-ribbon-domain-containing protein [Fimicolochytrium jonesii]|uniref:zinc-ribbon-domain-containing protein n=1 Tax=Fimicolochytrium jonesii TaxID=1396493 RepID=UPI0022FE9B27|nr:zinc-ribbon-domain-containing protein [Fimicolochytrium jonesii]KAI8827239.1 zinc-ribbon-domain-containing protein [Fimicolochytrium jonesii]